jgi:hypothetical protein
METPMSPSHTLTAAETHTTVLSLEQLQSLSAGVMRLRPVKSAVLCGCTGATRSVCHIDGVDDGDARA